jgi:hypothetical protein
MSRWSDEYITIFSCRSSPAFQKNGGSAIVKIYLRIHHVNIPVMCWRSLLLIPDWPCMLFLWTYLSAPVLGNAPMLHKYISIWGNTSENKWDKPYISAIQHPNEHIIYLESAQYNVCVLEVFRAIVCNMSKFPLKQTNITSHTIQQDARKHKKMKHQQKCKTGNNIPPIETKICIFLHN